MTEPHRQGREEGAGNGVSEGVAGRAWVILEGRWFITVAKSKDAGSHGLGSGPGSITF